MGTGSIKRHTIDMIFPVALLFVFAVSAVVVLIFATSVYREAVDSSVTQGAARTSVSYVTEKLHQSDGKVAITKLDGAEALAITEEIQGKTYITYIYSDDGSLKELFAEDGFAASKKDGRSILEIKDFEIEKLKDGLYRFTCTDTDGNTAMAVAGTR